MIVSELADILGAKLEGDPSLQVKRVNSLENAKAGDVSFLSSSSYFSKIEQCQATAILVPKNFNGNTSCAILRVENPDRSFGEAALCFYKPPPLPMLGVHESAIVACDVKLGKDVSIGANSVIESNVVLGDRVVIGPNSVIGHGAVINKDSYIYAGVIIREFVEIGSRVIIHSGSVIGSDGFGYAIEKDGSRWKIPQIGIVQIEDDVEIGSNVSIDRARFGKSIVGRGTKIDNLVQIAHNVVIGKDCVICGQVGIAGSANIGSNTILAGQVGVGGHVKIGKGVIANAKSGLVTNIDDNTHVMGMPAVDRKVYQKAYFGMLKLSNIKNKLKILEKRIEDLINK